VTGTPPHEHLWAWAHRDDGKGAFWYCILYGCEKPYEAKP
jgi:hypothetical protein